MAHGPRGTKDDRYGLKRAFSFISPKANRKGCEKPLSPYTATSSSYQTRYVPSIALLGDQRVGKSRLIAMWRKEIDENHIYESTKTPSVYYIPDKGYVWDTPSNKELLDVEILKKCKVYIVTGPRIPTDWISFLDTNNIQFIIIDREGKLVEDGYY